MAQDPWHTFVGQISAVFIILFDLYLSSSFIQARILFLDSFRANWADNEITLPAI